VTKRNFGTTGKKTRCLTPAPSPAFLVMVSKGVVVALCYHSTTCNSLFLMYDFCCLTVATIHLLILAAWSRKHKCKKSIPPSSFFSS